MTGLEIFDKVAYGLTLFHRDDDAWDLIDSNQEVAAVLCPRKTHLSISPVEPPVAPARVGKKLAYGETVRWKISEDAIDEGIAVLHALHSDTPPPA